MANQKKKWGDRRDATWLRDLPAMNQIMPTIMPNRADNEAYISLDIDLRPLDAYLEKLNAGRTEDKYTYFHLVSAAIGKAFILRPKMNRFICGHKVFMRNKVTVAFVVKKKFEDRSEEGLAFLEYAPDDTIESFHQKIMKVIHATRRTDVKDTSSGAMDILIKMPHLLMVGLVKLIRLLDRFGMDIPITPLNAYRFRAVVEVAVSPQFYGWVASLGGDIVVRGPSPVVREMQEFSKRLARQYAEG